MPSYQLPSSRLRDVIQGKQPFALQLPRKTTSPRHVRVGEPMTLRIANRSLPGECVARAVIHMDKAGIRRVLDQKVSSKPGLPGDPIIARLLNAENGSATATASLEAVAHALGHADYEALWRAEWEREDGRGKVSRGIIAREVVGWVSAEMEP